MGLVPFRADLMQIFMNKDFHLLASAKTRVNMDFTGPMETMCPVNAKFLLYDFNLLRH